MRKIVCLALAAAVSPVFGEAPGAGDAVPSAPLPKLEVLASYEPAPELSVAYDIRWADEKSIYLLRVAGGVTRNGLETGLPDLERVLPGAQQGSRIDFDQRSFAVSDEFVYSTTLGVYDVWHERRRDPREIRIRTREMFLATDIDLFGDELSLLAFRAEATPEGDLNGEVGVFRTSIADGEYELELLSGEKLLGRAQTAAPSNAMHVGAGSLRYSARGRLLVALGYREEILLLSPAGKIKERWALTDLGISVPDRSAILRNTRLSTEEQTSLWRKAAIAVEDVLWIGSSPAVLLRSTGDRVEWLLALLDRGKSGIYRVPLQRPESVVRIRMDGNSHEEIVALLGREIDESGNSSPSPGVDQVLVYRIPVPDQP
ncbi:MAG: hypothetical protein ACREA0_15840 [bacterium]